MIEEKDELDIECDYCENWKRRGDELVDECDEIEGRRAQLSSDVDKLQACYDEKCDEYKKLIILNGKLRALLSDKGIDHEY